MSESSLACLFDPQLRRPFAARGWVEDQFRLGWPTFAEHEPRPDAGANAPVSPRSRAWTVGCVAEGETLIQTRPVVRDPRLSFVDDLLRTPAACTLAQYRVQSAQGRAPEFKDGRYPRWVSICDVHRGLSTERAKKVQARDHLRRNLLPDFLRRQIVHNSDEELLFLGFLAHLHRAASLLRPSRIDASACLAAMRALDDELTTLLGEPLAVELWVTNGREFCALHRGHRLGLIRAPGKAKAANKADNDLSGVALLMTTERRDIEMEELPEGPFALPAQQPDLIVS